MSKIVTAVNAMITNSYSITNVLTSVELNEYFFIYNTKFKWSIAKYEDDYLLCYYNINENIEYMASIGSYSLPQNNYMRYSTEEIKTREARESFEELYSIVKEKIFGLDVVLDEIIKTDVPF